MLPYFGLLWIYTWLQRSIVISYFFTFCHSGNSSNYKVPVYIHHPSHFLIFWLHGHLFISMQFHSPQNSVCIITLLKSKILHTLSYRSLLICRILPLMKKCTRNFSVEDFEICKPVKWTALIKI